MRRSPKRGKKRAGNAGPRSRVPGLSRQDVTRIIAYVRELQRANGVY